MKTNQTFFHRQFLLEIFEQRRQRNARYSLRAFAQSLGVSPATLSKVLAGHRKLSLKMASQVCQQVGMNPGDSQRFMNSVQSDLIGSDDQHDYALSSELTRLTMERFKVIAHWEHYALLALATSRHNKMNLNKLSDCLGLPSSRVSQAVKRLEELGMLKIESGRFRRLVGATSAGDGTSQVAVRSFHTQLIEKAQKALQEVPVERRDISALTVAIPGHKLEEARELIREFRANMRALLDDSDDADSVYALAVQFFPLTKEF